MRIESVRIENFRGFKDETVDFENYTCLVGPNGAGKSTILTALNVFFRQYRDSKTDLSKLSVDDFHHRDVSRPIKITVTFKDISSSAANDLSDYVRQDRLIVSCVATYDPSVGRADVKQYGNRLGIEDFRRYFEQDKAGASASELRELFASMKSKYPAISEARTKADMAAALREFEANHPELCSIIPSEDQFYGASKGTNRLAPHVQWVFVAASKDIVQEGEETKNSALGQLLARTIRSRVNFAEKLERIRASMRAEYQKILETEQGVLDNLSLSLQLKLRDWAHPEATAQVRWKQDPDNSVQVDEPSAHIWLGERGFEGELARFGHGMQRSYMLTLLQELAGTDSENAPTLIMAIEEPELYQHPPQARYLGEVLQQLTEKGAQVLVCSHSPFFVPGDNFEAVRVVRERGNPRASYVARLTYDKLASTLKVAGQQYLKENGMVAKLYPTLNPSTSEMFFCKVLILTEGHEDIAYIASVLELTDSMGQFRKHGCHIVAVGGKSELIKPIAMARLLKIPVFVVADADTNKDKPDEIARHKKDNKAILSLLGYGTDDAWPTSTIWKDDLVIWKTNLTDEVAAELGQEWSKHFDVARAQYDNAPGLTKNPLAIACALESAWKANVRSELLNELADRLLAFARGATAPSET
ncbi:MAG: ATP-dependent endonuclease [Thiohalomonadaceae bacterium]